MVLLTVLGAVILLTAWLPMILKELPLSLPIACIAIGIAVQLSPVASIVAANPLESRALTERLTEFVVIIALMGAGLKLERPFSLRGWGVTWRLLAIAMPLSIAATAFLGWWGLGLGLPAALLLGAALAPTDPVLASDVQVGPPGSGDTDEVRFALTSEAGLNDGLAFPFVYLAIGLAGATGGFGAVLGDWFLVDVVFKLTVGIGLGWLGGKAMGYLLFHLPDRAKISRTGDGFVALGITCLAYGSTEIVGGYGFLAVFIAALTLRSQERKQHYLGKMHDFVEELERLVMMVLLVCFGAAIAEGSVFSALNLPVILVSLAILFIVRPIAGWTSLIGHNVPAREKAVISFFGIRGLGSFYYLAYALGHAEFFHAGTLWVTVCCVVVISIVLHGVTVTPIMRYLDRNRESGSEA
ncbi:cation:proton antiporter [Devosia sp.]|uniref:cation:proton antiporter n=1 Tax=Devosia sp. TaxID=1871048 RepID=UPI003A9134B6